MLKRLIEKDGIIVPHRFTRVFLVSLRKGITRLDRQTVTFQPSLIKLRPPKNETNVPDDRVPLFGITVRNLSI
jgi:hypothetical protein